VTQPPNGRGLLDPHELAQAAAPEAIPLPVELLDANPRNPRGKLPEVDALAASIKQFGLLQLRVYSDSVLSGFVQSGQLSRGVAEEFLILRDLDTRRDFAERAVRENWSQDQARGRVRALRQDLERADVGRLARELHDRLDRLGEGTVSVDAFTELWSLSERIGALWQAAQGKPARRRMPSIEEAQRAAGVRTQERPLKRGERQKPGYKPRQDA
jgi:hypothetical protein